MQTETLIHTHRDCPRFFKIIIYILTFSLLITSGLSFAAESVQTPPQTKYSILLYANNTIYRMAPDGSNREKLVEKANVLEIFPLSGGRILVHSKQYEGESLEIFDPSNNAWILVEFTEGKIPSISVSENGINIAYEIKHFPISINGDGVWIFDSSGAKSHVKISNTALAIESMIIHDGKLLILFHELNLVSDEAGLFIEAYSLDKSAKPARNRVPEGMKMILRDGWTLGFLYPSKGRKLRLAPIGSGRETSVDIPNGDIILYREGLHFGNVNSLVFDRQTADFVGAEFKETLVWNITTGKIETLLLKDLTDCNNYNWSPDAWLYFTACYADKSGDRTSPMLFRTNDLGKNVELVSIHGGIFTFQNQ